jgi:hypothetical protein
MGYAPRGEVRFQSTAKKQEPGDGKRAVGKGDAMLFQRLMARKMKDFAECISLNSLDP